METAYIITGECCIDEVYEAVAFLEEELGVRVRVIYSPNVKGVLVNGILVDPSPEDIAAKAVETMVSYSNIESLILACCS